ncbi:TPA: cytochrome c [Legionella anisa]|uniref:c-type cytochrome n=1 Tax=Legionella anisa TaxID=28082 RepID=UPI001980A06A|nr:cytochrome c [Legionella anisa]MBN5937595.1 c-type cytochrome [Legionella anisa]
MMCKGFIFWLMLPVVAFTFSANTFASEFTSEQKVTQTLAEKSNDQFKTATSKASGKAIYYKACIACHGANGKGTAPSFPDFTKKGGVLSKPTSVLFNNIKQGIGNMPAKGGYPSLTDEEIQTTLNYIESTFSSESTLTSTLEQNVTQIPPWKSKGQLNKTAESKFLGEVIYHKTCVACHGADGKGTAPSFPDFTKKGGALSKPTSVLFYNIKQGIGSMPAKGGYPALTDEDIQASLDYIESTFAPESIPEQQNTQTQEIQLMRQQLKELTQKVAALESTKSKEQIAQTNQQNTNQKLTNSKTLNKNSEQVNLTGKVIYQKSCSACHGANGKGIAPSIPDFSKKGGVLSQPSNILLNNIKQGIGSMPAKGGDSALTDQDLKDVLDYIKNTFPAEQKGMTTQPTTPVKTQVKNTNQANTIKTPYFWPNPDISGLITGAASAGYSIPNNHSGRFDILNFTPMFLFRYKDLLFLHSDVDFSLDDDGVTNVELDTLNLNLFLNDYAVFGIGEFESPLGYFTQNLSPSWVNRLPTAPAGFHSNEAAPQSQLGAQLRGGFYFLSSLKVNYITFVANGPRAFADTTTGLIDYISTASFPNNYGNFIGGGRIGILPIPELEIGFSGAGGKLALFDVNTNMILGEIGRDYSSLGADLSFKWKDWDFRAEVIQQQIGPQVTSLFPQKECWKAWYLQAAYWIPATKFQPIVRWGGYTSPVSSQSLHQVALGVDYWVAPSIAVQAAYEINRGEPFTESNNNLFLIQLVFGF